MFTTLKKVFSRSAIGRRSATRNSPSCAPVAERSSSATELKQRGNSQHERGQLEEAVQSYAEALVINPMDVGVMVNLGFVLSELKRLDAARFHLERALGVDPTQADAHYILATIHRSTGEPEVAMKKLRAALAARPDFEQCRLDLCHLLFENGELQAARQIIEAGISIQPHVADFHFYLGNLHHEAGMYDEAIAEFERALHLAPDQAGPYCNMGKSFKEKGDLDAAIDCVRTALRLQPGFEVAQLWLLFFLNYHPDKSAAEIFAAYREYDERFGLPFRGTWRSHSNSRDPSKRLKVGYVSPDFRQHSTRHFLEPLLARHDKSAVEIFAYAELTNEDATTGRYRACVDHWIQTVGLTDEELANRIRSDGVDVLVDLAGHTANNRLGAFVRKPAPVSISWLGYGYTTGLSAIDYLLIDDISAPSGSDCLFAEMPWRLPTPAYVYRPDPRMGEVGALPALDRGYVTFGTLTRSIRINHRTIRVWASILTRLPHARLVADSLNFRDKSTRDAMIEKFGARGIAPERLAFGCHSPPWDVLRGMDIGLDCFPHNSGTTLFETLYMGVPFVTLADRPSVGRIGSSILHGVGHPEWIAHSEDEYIDLAVNLASDLPRLARIRAGLRAEMEASPLRDEAGFARKVEAAYREMFAIWAKSSDPVR